MVTTRTANEHDEARALELLRQLWAVLPEEIEHDPDAEEARAKSFRRMIGSDRGTVLLAEDDGQVLGLISVSFNLAIRYETAYAQIEELVVDEAHNNTDDFERLSGVLDPVADRILGAEVAAGQSFADDRHRWTGGSIAVGEPTTALYRNTEGGQIGVADVRHYIRTAPRAWRQPLPCDLVVVAEIGAVRWCDGRQRRGLDARDGLYVLEQSVPVRTERAAFPEVLASRRHEHHQHSFRPCGEPTIHAAEEGEAADQQPCPN